MDETVSQKKEPKKVGRYEIKSELGRGGMATVYLGYDALFEREVAVKVLPAEFLHDPQFSLRFQREAKVVAALEHPAIVPVYDVGEADGLPYFVMRYMDGGSLADLLEKGEISLKEVSRIISTIAPALDDSHEKGIIHRDHKPANILFDRHKQPYLSDFGIAKVSDAQTNMTGSAIIGTPAYMSPEQAQGKEVDGRSDIYALGAIIYRMLTGTRPFNGDTPMSMAIKHITDPTPDILNDNSALPISTTAFIYRAMAKDPDARFQTARGLAEVLATVASGEETVDTKTIHSRTKLSMPAPQPTEEKKAQPKEQQKKKKSKIGWVLGGIILVGLAGVGLLSKFIFPPAVAEHTSTPIVGAILASTATDPAPVSPPTVGIAPSVIPSPSATETPAPAEFPVLGGADKIAMVANNDLWMMNVDGSDLVQLTSDGTTKSKLQWMPDGKTLIYVVGKCIQTMDTEEDRVDVLTCFQQAEYFDAIQLSPSGEKIAISMNRDLFILPFDLDQLANARTRSDLQAMDGCFYNDESVLGVRWHDDETKIAMRFAGTSPSGSRADLIRIVDISNCQSAAAAVATGTAVAESPEDDDYKLFFLDTEDEFPANRFTMSGYSSTTPYIPSYDWDGSDVFLMNSFKRNDGYGYFYTYNARSHKAEQIDPVGKSTCCYIDVHWSPDGSHFIVAYQDIALGGEAETELYYLLFGTLGTGASYTPMSLPDGFFRNLKQKPQFTLRAAQ